MDDLPLYAPLTELRVKTLKMIVRFDAASSSENKLSA